MVRGMWIGIAFKTSKCALACSDEESRKRQSDHIEQVVQQYRGCEVGKEPRSKEVHDQNLQTENARNTNWHTDTEVQTSRERVADVAVGRKIFQRLVKQKISNNFVDAGIIALIRCIIALVRYDTERVNDGKRLHEP